MPLTKAFVGAKTSRRKEMKLVSGQAHAPVPKIRIELRFLSVL